MSTVVHINKSSRYTLGAKIDTLLLDSIQDVSTALYLPKDKKSVFIARAIAQIDLLKLLISIAWENNLITTKQYDHLGIAVEEVGRILGGWKRGLEQTKLPH